jgi:hypothetical protein
VIATDAQVEPGLRQALDRVQAPGVLIEGCSFLKFRDVDFAVMVARAGREQIKPTARRALPKTHAFYLSGAEDGAAREWFALWSAAAAHHHLIGDLPVYTRANLPQLIARLRTVLAPAATSGE